MVANYLHDILNMRPTRAKEVIFVLFGHCRASEISVSKYAKIGITVAPFFPRGVCACVQDGLVHASALS